MNRGTLQCIDGDALVKLVHSRPSSDQNVKNNVVLFSPLFLKSKKCRIHLYSELSNKITALT